MSSPVVTPAVPSNGRVTIHLEAAPAAEAAAANPAADQQQQQQQNGDAHAVVKESANGTAAAFPASTAASPTVDVESGDAAHSKPAAAHQPTAPPNIDSANVLSKWTFWWLNSLLALGYKRPLQTEDVPELPPAEQAQTLADEFEVILAKVYREYQPGSKATEAKEDSAAADSSKPLAAPATLKPPPSLVRAIWSLIGPKFIVALVWAFISETLAFAGPIIVQFLTQFLNDPSQPDWIGWMFVALLFVLPSIASVARNAYFLDSWRVAVRVRVAILTSVFRKSLKLSPAARRLVSDGESVTNKQTSALHRLSAI
jgi:ATP-binding cassette subfamily C (CFTR/MRP) protein 1